ncbi:hypothetical protein [Flavobacterium sp. ZS1P14]|uniref:hypothetical protein n=1 Tax=Flavobacterium sp. ZS1P14 TaxID=3401729 RepID=UPI003AADAE34
MKKLLHTTLFLLFTYGASSQTTFKKLIASTCESRGCTGSEYCSACKNCSGCKHCNQNGGTCGVCAPTTKNKTISKKIKSNKNSIKTRKQI